MTKNQVSEVLERVRAWPQQRQEEAARILIEIETHDACRFRLSDDQLAEVRRRRANRNPVQVSLADARKRFN
jgi:hypothetical protein